MQIISKHRIPVIAMIIVTALLVASLWLVANKTNTVPQARASQDQQTTQLQTTNTNFADQPTTTQSQGTNSTQPIKPSSLATPQPAAQPSSDAPSLNPQNTWHPNISVLTVHVTYDGSGQGCHKWVTETCYYPFAGQTIEIRNLKGSLVTSSTSDVSGQVSFKLAPGKYKVVPLVSSEIMHPQANTEVVDIVEGGPAEINVNYWAIATTNTVVLPLN